MFGANIAQGPNGVFTGGGASPMQGTTNRNALTGALSANVAGVPWALAVLIVVYLAWALIERHERVQDAIEPHNVALNVRNLFAVGLPVVIFILLLKVAVAKFAALLGQDSSVGDTLSNVVGAI